MSNPTIETITNNLAEGYNSLEKGTFQEASEVQNQRRADHSLRNRWIYTANLPLFRIQEGNLEYGLGGMQAFDAIAGEDIDKFTGEILNSERHVYNLTSPQIQLLSGLDGVDWAKDSDLRLHKETSEWSYFLIDTSDIHAKKLNGAQRPFAVKVHGSLEARYDSEQELPDYGENMSMLRKKGKIEQTRLWLPNPDYIMDYLQDGKVVARASRLNNFGGSSSFDADDWGVYGRLALRGVPIIGEADAQKSKTDVVKDAYKTILNNPLTDETATGLFKYITNHFRNKQIPIN